MGLRKKIRAAIKPVKHTPAEAASIQATVAKGPGNRGLRSYKNKPLPTSKILEVTEEAPESQATEFVPISVRGSGNKVYKLVIPKSYARLVPKNWSWNAKRYEVAEKIAAGFPITKIAKECEVDRTLIYGWLQHPEFKDHVDGLTLESGWANRRERIAGLNRVTRLLFDKVVAEIDKVKLTDKSIGPVLSSLYTIAKQISQEKGEFIEQTKVEQETTLNGTIGVATVDVASMLNSKPASERAELETEFNKLGDEIIRSITGEKD